MPKNKIKVAKYDYNIASLPKNRKEQFKDILKHNFGLLVKLGLLLFLFSIPYLISIIIKDVSLLSILSSDITDQDKIYSMQFTTKLIYNITLILVFPIMGVGISGILRIFKNLIYSEPIFFWDDFKVGIKENIKPVIVISILMGVFAATGEILYLIINNTALRVIAIAINYGLIFPICLISLFVSTTYKNSFMVNLKTAVILFIKFFPILVLFYFSYAILASIKFIPLGLFFVKYILIALFMVLIYPMTTLGIYCYLTHVFDENINKEQFKDYYKKGLYIKK